jgi:hypothetical protein
VLVEMRSVLGGTPVHEGYAALTPDFRRGDEAMGEMAAARPEPTRTSTCASTRS